MGVDNGPKDMMERLKTLAGILALLWMCVIFAFSAQEKDESSVVSEGISYQMVNSAGLLFHLNLDAEEMRRIAAEIENSVRKAAHMTEFGILFILVYIWLGKWVLSAEQKSLSSFLFSTLYAASDELHQLFVLGRAGSIKDVMIDAAGAFTGLVIILGVKYVSIFCRSITNTRKEHPHHGK